MAGAQVRKDQEKALSARLKNFGSTSCCGCSIFHSIQAESAVHLPGPTIKQLTVLICLEGAAGLTDKTGFFVEGIAPEPAV